MKSSLFIIIAFFVSLAVLCGLFWLFWLNRGTDKSVSIIFKTVVPSLVFALVLFVYEMFMVPLPERDVTVPVLVLYDQCHRIVPMERVLENESFDNVYFVIKAMTDEWVAKNRKAILSGEIRPGNEYYQDLMELSLVHWLCNKYRPHWRVRREYFQMIGGGVGRDSPAPDAEESCVVIERDQLIQLLKANFFIIHNAIAPLWIERFCLPAESIIKIKRTQGKGISFVIANPHLELTVEIRSVGGQGINNPKIRDMIKEVAHYDGELWSNGITFKFTCQQNRWRRWSLKTEQQIQWIDELISGFRADFDWNSFLQELKEQIKHTKPH